MYMQEKEKEVIELIPFGKENAISLNELQDLVHMNKRNIRRAIEKDRENINDYVIVSSCKFKGFYKTKNTKEIELFIEEQTKRAKKILWNLKAAKQFLGEKDQLRIIWE